MIVRGVVDGIPTGARGAAFESNELRSEPIRTRKDNRARVKQRQYIPIKIALALVRRAVRDTVLTEKFSGEFAGYLSPLTNVTRYDRFCPHQRQTHVRPFETR
jgi:hypothetical protein